MLYMSCTGAFGQKTELIDGKLNGILPLDENGRPSYQVVGKIDGASKDQLFRRARSWFVKSYKSANDVLQVNDANSGDLAGKGLFYVTAGTLGVGYRYPVRHLLSLEAREGKYRITLTDFSIDDPKLKAPIDNVPSRGRKFYDEFFGKLNQECMNTITSLQKAVETANDF